MSANASHVPEGDDPTHALARFARALCAGEDVCGWLASEAALARALDDAQLAARNARHPEGARAAAYRALICAHASGRAAHRLRRPASHAVGQRPGQKPGLGNGLGNGLGPAAGSGAPSEASRTIAALARLEQTERAALLLVAIERLPYGEAAQALDLTEVDLVEALARAREAFAALLAAAGARGRPHLKLVG